MNAQSKVTAPTLAKLREPFPPNCISKLPRPTAKREVMDKLPKAKCPDCGGYHATSKIIHLDYVGHAALTDRLLDTDPEWTWEPVAWGDDGLPAFDRNGGLWIKLTVLGVTRLGYGNAANKPNQDPGNREKEVIGDALRNAAMRVGAALDLWHKGDLHVEDDGEKPDDQGVPDAEFSKLAGLLKATGVPASKLLKEYGVKNLRQINQTQYADAIERLNNILAEKAKEEGNKSNEEFGDVVEEEVPF